MTGRRKEIYDSDHRSHTDTHRPDTANRKLRLSDNNSKVTIGTERQPYPGHSERFDYWKQVMCTEGLTGRCYWEVEWEGQVYIAVTYKGIKRKGQGDDSCLGRSGQSWSLGCTPEKYLNLHSNKIDSIDISPSSRVGVYLDWPELLLLFVFHFSQPLMIIIKYCSPSPSTPTPVTDSIFTCQFFTFQDKHTK